MFCRYYLNGVDAYRLKLLLPLTQKRQDELAAQQLAELQLSGNDSNKTDISGSSQHPSVGESADAQNAAALRRDHDLSSDNASANSCSHHHDLKLDQKS